METIGFYIFYGINWIMTLLPLRVLYFLSDILFFLLYYPLSYRKKVVTENLMNSFPEKSPEEIKVISKKYYSHLADIMIETLKLTHLTNKELKKRMTYNNPELVEQLYKSGRDVAAVHSHFNNWEWLTAIFPLYTRYETIGVYKPIKNQLFDRFLNKQRSRNNGVLVPMKHIFRKIIDNQNRNIRTLYGFMADQTPAKSQIRYYTSFLNQDTPVFLGVEKIAVKYDMSVVFVNVRKVRRGYYDVTMELLFESTAGLKEYEVTEKHVKRLEELIKENPEYWIWTHRRWKYKKNVLDD